MRTLRPRPEYEFIPRIINPLKVRDVVLFAADEEVRKARPVIQAELPWTQVHAFTNPLDVSAHRSDGAVVVIMDDAALNLVDVDRLRRSNSDVAVVLLSFNRRVQSSPPAVVLSDFPYTAKADLIFAANRGEFAPDRIITSVVRAAEDHLNVSRCTGAHRFVVLIVDDEPSWPSQFLPVLYRIIGQRADVKVVRTYEAALQFLFGVEDEAQIPDDYAESGYGDQVVCLITDIFFPRGDRITSDAGKELIRLTQKYYPRIPIIIASKASEAAGVSNAGFVMPKGDPGSLETLKRYLRDFTGIGDFVVQDEEGRELHRVRDVRELYGLLVQAEGEDSEAERLRRLLEAYGEKDMFSTWFYMHSLRELGDRLRPQRLRGKRLVTTLRRSVRCEALRMQLTPLIVEGIKVYSLEELLAMLRSTPPESIEPFSHNDVISSWLDRMGYSELAERLRPIHGKGPELRRTIAEIVAEWIGIYRRRGQFSKTSGAA